MRLEAKHRASGNRFCFLPEEAGGSLKFLCSLLFNEQPEQLLPEIDSMKPVKSLNNLHAKKASTTSTLRKARTKTTGSARGAKPVTIEARIDVGFGNSLYVRGEGTGLSWNRGVPLTCIDGNTWKWSTEADDNLKFKLLLNDAIWAAGEDWIAAPGEKLEIKPQFS
jgi:hypothetical protein